MRPREVLAAAIAVLLTLFGARLYWGHREKKALESAAEARRVAVAAGDDAARARADARIDQIHEAAEREAQLPIEARLRRAYERAVRDGFRPSGSPPSLP